VTGVQTWALPIYQVADEEDAEFAVDDKQKKKRGENTVYDETEEAGNLHEGIGKRVEKFAEVADLVAFAGGKAVEQIGNLRDDEGEPKRGYRPTCSMNEPRRKKPGQQLNGKKHRRKDNTGKG
jgi:hypothetical protein